MWFLGYFAILTVAAVLFSFAVLRERNWAAIGLLLLVSGLQLGAQHAIELELGLGIATVGMISIARDVVPRASARTVAAGLLAHRNEPA